MAGGNLLGHSGLQPGSRAGTGEGKRNFQVSEEGSYQGSKQLLYPTQKLRDFSPEARRKKNRSY